MTKVSKRITLILAILLSISITFLTLQAVGIESDVWWHLKFGQELLEGRRIDGIDTWSWVKNPDGSNLTWIQHEWLFALILAVLNYMPGGMYVLSLLYVACISGYLLYRLFPILTTPKSLVFGTLFISIGCGFLLPASSRPHTLGIICVLAYMHFLWKYAYSRNTKYLVPLPLVAVFWTNVWGGTALLSVCMIGALLLQDLLKHGKILQTGLTTVLTTIACFCTPVGWKSVLFRIFNSADQSLVKEWAPTQFKDVKAFWMISLVVVIVLLYKRLQVFEWCITAGFWVLASIWIRCVFLVLFVTVFLLIYHVTPGKSDKDLSDIFKSLWTGLVFLVSVCCIASFAFLVSPATTRMCNPVSQEVIISIKQENPQRLYTSMNSGYLIYNDIPVFVDSRADPYTEFYTDTLKVEVGQAPFESLNDVWDFDYALIPKYSPLLDQLSEYPIIAQDNYWVFYKLK